MKFFTFNHGETESALERALLSTPFSGEIKFNYTGTVKNKDTATASSVYLLPVDSHEGVIYGYFTIDGKLAEVPIGVLRKNNFLFKEHFRPSLNGGIVKQNKPDEGILYLPLKLTDLVLALGEPKEGTFVPHEGSPFSVFGIEGSQGVQPLIFVSETENGIMCRGIYNDKDRQLSTYEHNGMRIADKTIRDFLRELRGVKLVTPQKNNLEKTVHADPIKTSEMTKPLENVIN
jgi:hypothetical protein